MPATIPTKSQFGKLSNVWDRYIDPVITILGSVFLCAFVGIFLENRYPVIHPFVYWTLRVWFAIFIVGLLGMVLGLMVVGPGVVLAKDAYSHVLHPNASMLEKKLTAIWCGGAGVLFSLVLGTAYGLQAFGIVTNIKLWFVALCFVILMIPLWLLGRSIQKWWLEKKRPTDGANAE